MAAISRRLNPRSIAALPWLGLLLTACAGQGDVDRTQLDKVDKAIFVNADGTPKTFYYRKTTIGVPPTSSYAFEGTMGELMKVRFEIGKELLLAYRAFDYAPGAQNPMTGGANNKDTPLMVFKISSHFDVKREYNPATGEETNVISENTTDRDWSEREFMRVDWSRNLAEASFDVSFADPMNMFFGAQTLDTGYFVGEGDDALINPNRPVVTKGYVDFTTKEFRTPDYNACMRLFDTFDDAGPWGCGPAEITYRNSLMPVGDSEYEPLAYPDKEVLTDDAGKPIRYAFPPVGDDVVTCTPAELAKAGLTGDDCITATADQFAKFGFFRTVRPTYDREVGSTEEGRKYFANRWNIWDKTILRNDKGEPMLDANGEPQRIKLSARQTRKITYYMNPEFPEDQALRDEAGKVMEDWNVAMKQTVAGARFVEQNPNSLRVMGALKGDAEAMPNSIFELKPNSCELGNVQAFVAKHPDIKQRVASRVSREKLDLDNLDKAHLLQACSALSAVTENLPDNDNRKFTWQRNGDLRYSFLYWVDRPQPGGPLGYGPSSADPETGEIISASAYIYGASLDTYAKYAADSVKLANGTLDTDDLLSGKTISDVLTETKLQSKAREEAHLTDAARTAAYAKLKSPGRTQSQAGRLVKVASGIDDQAIARIKGTALEKLLVNDDVLPGLVPGYKPGDTPPADAFDKGMNQPWFSSQAAEARRDRFQKLAAHGCLYMADFADDAILGTALEMAELPPEDLFKALRVSIFRGLSDHEVGHTMGLRHNFSSSTDAFNYDDKYWQIRANMPKDEWEKNKLSEFGYASVMDYGSRFNSDVQGLGKYDTAAIRFGYGQLIDLTNGIDNGHVNSQLNQDILLEDYSSLPRIVGGLDKMDISGTAVASYAGSKKAWRDGFKNIATNHGSFGGIYPERPYKFCSDEFEGNYDCKTWDKGANQREIIGNVTDMFRNYHVFNAYKRGRTTWQIDDYLNRLESRYFNRYGQAFQFFYFFGDSLAGTPFGDDLLLASMDALNALGAVLQTPEPGIHCATAYSPDVLIVPNDPEECLPSSPQAMMNVPDAKPFFINFSDDYYYRITRTGSLYEKLEALMMLTSTESRFFRVDTFADSNRYSINYYRIFRDEVIKLLSGVIRNDPRGYGATLETVAGTSGAPGYTHLKATPVVDPDTYGLSDPPTPAYAQPGTPHFATPVNKTIRYWALLLSLARLGSTWDSTLDFQNFLVVTAKGADDDFDIKVGPNITVKEFTHPETGMTFRAPAYIASSGAAPSSRPQNIGANILDDLNAIVGTQGTPGKMPIRFGSYTNGQAFDDWYTAKAKLDAAFSKGDQAGYVAAQTQFQIVNDALSYLVDLVGDIRLTRKQLNLLNTVLQ